MPISALRRLCVPLIVVAVVIALLALSSGDTSTTKAEFGDPQFFPILDVHPCNGLPDDFVHPTLQGPNPRTAPDYGGCGPDNTAPGSHPDLTTQFLIPAGDYNYAQDYWVTMIEGFTVVGDAAIADGSLAGGLSSIITLGLTANACNLTIFPDFIWWEGEADNNIANEVVTAAEGTPNRWASVVTNGGDGFTQEADSNSPMVTGYPDFLNRLFDPDGDGIDTDGNPATIADQPVTPLARYAGATRVPANGDWQMLQNIIFAPGDLQEAFSANPNTSGHGFAKLTGSQGTADIGYPSVVILNDPTAVVSSVSAISDFCSILGTQGMLLGNSGGVDRVTAPAGDGDSHFASARTQSYRDEDGDGIQNDIDTCPYAANTENVYNDNGPDDDNFDSVCDPTPGTNTSAPPSNQPGDHDGDYYQNAQDLSPNSQNIDPGHAGAGESDIEATLAYDTTAPDGGPAGDQIGDDADSDDIISDGLFFNMIYVGSVCVTSDPATDDADDDGWCTDTDPNDGDANIPGSTYSLQLPSTGDDDGDDDSSGSIYTRANDDQEWAVGTDPMNNCPQVPEHDTWPPDINADGLANILDIFQLTPPVFGASPPNPAYLVRKDLNSDGIINILDIFLLTPPIFGKNCSQ